MQSPDVFPGFTAPWLVTMEESRGRFSRLDSLYAQYGVSPQAAWDSSPTPHWIDRVTINVADNWLVKAVNRRIIGGIPGGANWVRLSGRDFPMRDELLRLFCGKV